MDIYIAVYKDCMPEKLINVVFHKSQQQDYKTTNSFNTTELPKEKKHTIIIFNINEKKKNLTKLLKRFHYFFLHVPGPAVISIQNLKLKP